MQTNCYIVYEDGCGILVDPGEEALRILETVHSLRLNITHIVLTHAHYDHIMALQDIQDAFPGAKLCIGCNEQEVLQDRYKNLMIYVLNSAFVPSEPDLLLQEGDVIPVGNSSLKVLETPGHTVGSICLYGEGILLSGDTLFCQGMGRCDLPTGDLRQEVHSILNKLFVLPDDTVVFPGHGPETTIGFEKKNNEVSLYK